MSRDHDRHTVEVRYRTVKMAERDAKRLRGCGWRVHEFTDEPVLHVETYKPVTLFGPIDLQGPVKNPDVDGWYRERDRWRHGIVGWSLACGCGAWRLADDARPSGITAELQPVGAGGAVYFPAAEYVIERVSWPCVERSDRASVAVRLPDEPYWRGRTVMAAESAVVALLPDLTSAQRQCYIDTRDIPELSETFEAQK